MTYFVTRQQPQYRQMSLEEFLFGFGDEQPRMVFNPNIANTRTYTFDNPPAKLMNMTDVRFLIDQLTFFNVVTRNLRYQTVDGETVERPRKELYREFCIPKKSGGLRRIDAPNDELMAALRVLKGIFEDDFNALYHTSAFAYVKRRNAKDALVRHQQNKSKWFAKFDLSDFFGSTTLDYTMKMLSMIFPFSEVVKFEDGRNALREALELAFLDGGLPQGTPISPLITNLIMIPVDFVLFNKLRNFNRQRFVYTRYADDFLISSEYDFDFREIERLISDTLAGFDAPFAIKSKKTRYGSSSGKNWNLGMMLNEKNEITIGHKNKRRFEAMLRSYVLDRRNGNPWSKNDVQTLDGYRNYYKMIEGENIDKIVAHIGEVLGANIPALIKCDLKA